MGELLSDTSYADKTNSSTFQGGARSGMWSTFQDIPVHGDPVTGKANNTIRIYFEILMALFFRMGI